MSDAPIRLLVSDIDGTLVRHDKSLSDAVVAAVARLIAAGVKVSLVSARPPSGMLWIAERLALTEAVGAFNGGTLVRPDGTIVAAERIDPAAAAKALDLFDRPEITPWLFADGKWYTKTAEGTHIDRERRSANVDPTVRADFADLCDRADKIVGVSEDHDLLAKLEPELADALGDAATVVRSQAYYLDVTAKRGNKGDGVVALAQAAGVPLVQTVVIGDQRNDLAMFARAGLSIAMGQSDVEIRDAADHTTRSNDEDGVAAAIDEIILPAAGATP